MTQVSTRVMLTGVAVTVMIQWGKVLCKFSIFHHQASFTCHTGTIASDTRWQDAVEHINATNHPINQAIRRTDSHQVAWLVFRQKGRCEIKDGIHLSMALPNCQATDRIARKIHTHQVRSRLTTQILKACSLHNTKEALVMRTTMGLQTTLCPAAGALN